MRRFFDVVTSDLYKYKVLRLSYENASIFAAFALMAFIPGSPFFRHDNMNYFTTNFLAEKP